jgi:NAD(P)-dependent dehydrogenase (short-subunit alcohol dehydrogenase family)
MRNVLITGGTSGLGKAIVQELASQDFRISVLGRNKDKLAGLKMPNVHTIHGDATDERLIMELVCDLKPGILILNAGATPIMGSLEEQSWESFNTVWNTDVRAGLYGIQAALKTPLPAGSRVVVVTSGAAMVGAPLSGSYAGAKRMLWFMVRYAGNIAREKGLDITFQTLLPMQMIPQTEFARTIAGEYAEREGVTIENYVEARYGNPMSCSEYAKHVHLFLTRPEYLQGVAYGIHKDTGVKQIDD